MGPMSLVGHKPAVDLNDEQNETPPPITFQVSTLLISILYFTSSTLLLLWKGFCKKFLSFYEWEDPYF